MISGPALHARVGRPADQLGADHEVWSHVVHYLSAALTNFICTLSPQRVILGGGVMHRRHLFPPLRRQVHAMLNGYLQCPEIMDDMDAFVVPPGLGDDAGVTGALALAREAAGDPRDGLSSRKHGALRVDSGTHVAPYSESHRNTHPTWSFIPA